MYEKQKVELNRLQEKVAKGKISRREFMSRVSAMGLGAMERAVLSRYLYRYWRCH